MRLIHKFDLANRIERSDCFASLFKGVYDFDSFFRQGKVITRIKDQDPDVNLKKRIKSKFNMKNVLEDLEISYVSVDSFFLDGKVVIEIVE